MKFGVSNDWKIKDFVCWHKNYTRQEDNRNKFPSCEINNYIIKGLYASDSKFKWLKEKIAQNDARQI